MTSKLWISIIVRVLRRQDMRNLLKPLLAVKSKKGYSILTAVMVTLFSTWVVFDATKVKVVLADDGEVQTIKAHMSTVADLLETADITVDEHDYLSHDEEAMLTDGMKVQYKPAEKIELTVDGETEEHYTTATTVEEFFESVDFKVTEHDKLSHKQSNAIKENMEIVVDRAFEIKVLDGGEKESFWTTEKSVEQFLQDNEIELTELDKVKPKLNKQIDKDTEVTITRIEIIEAEVEEKIAYKTEEKSDSSLEKGKEKVKQEGKDGLAMVTYEITKENGKEVDREVLKEEEVKAPVNKIVKVGTKEPTVTTQSSSAPSGGGKVMTMEATGYGMDCKGCSGITATGIDVRNNPNMKVIAVDPSVIPLGSRVWVEGYGEAVAGDTGGAIKGNRIDVLLPSEAYAAQNWGRRTVQVRVLD